jgi:hypothetical protein
MPTLLLNGRVHSPSHPDATAMAVRDGVVAWLGTSTSGRGAPVPMSCRSPCAPLPAIAHSTSLVDCRVVGSSVITAISTSDSRVALPFSGASPIRHHAERLSNINPRVPSIGSTSNRNGGPPRPGCPNCNPSGSMPSAA